ncbi:histidine kinase [Nocardia sp. NPDC050712]|uniref:sensor histidine kinase n=1 Tax=Nocardia sp. NPDC050712 TaxID=3155518 RepID=UPI0033E5E006
MDVTQAMASSSARSTPQWGTESARERLRALRKDPVTVLKRAIEELPYDYPPSVLLGAELALFGVCVASVVQRYDYIAQQPLWLVLWVAIALWALLAVPVCYLFAVPPSPAILMPLAMAATAGLLIKPVMADLAPFVLVVTVGEVASILPKRWSALFAVAAAGELIVFDVAGHLWWSFTEGQRFMGMQMYLLGLALGWMVGVMLQYQRKFLYRERESQQILAIQAADEERRRIAREVHDVIAHSLSITLLHLTGARHALQTDRDVDEAVSALVDAERLGRQAMADIRRTVGLLDARPSNPVPEPGIGDIESLVGDCVRAGLDIRYAGPEDLSAVTAAVGLALYRISQESLANVAKHAPGARTSVLLRVDAATAALTVCNTLPGDAAPQRGKGMGLTGMRQRAELLGGRMAAGPTGEIWTVQVEFPLTALRNCWVPDVVAEARTVARENFGVLGVGTAAPAPRPGL